MSTGKRGWRTSPISPLAYAIRLNSVRQANIYSSCRLDKSNRQLYEPEDVWAKRAGLAKVDSRSRIAHKRARGKLKKNVVTLSTVGALKGGVEDIDRVKETAAVLMKSKERAAEMGAAERRILQPNLARKMARMSCEQKAVLAKRVQEAVEQLVYAAKRRYGRRQEQLDSVGIFHPEANAQRVHTLFWADLNKINLTEIENTVWDKMSAEAAEDAYDTSTASCTSKMLTGSSRLTNDSEILASITKNGDTGCEVGSGQGKWRKGVQPVPGKYTESITDRANSRESPRREPLGRTSGCEGAETAEKESDEESQDVEKSYSPAIALAPVADRFVDDLPGYDALGHVPSLEEFRSAWSKAKQRVGEEEDGATSRAGCRQSELRSQPQGTAQHNESSIVVEDLSNRDKVFRHFKRYYERAKHSRGSRAGNPLLPTGLLQPDLKVLETVGKHAAEARGRRNRVGEGVLSSFVVSAGGSKVVRGVRQRCFTGSSAASTLNGGDEGRAVQKRSAGYGHLTNIFWGPAPENEDAAMRVTQDSSETFANRAKSEGKLAVSGDVGEMNRDGKGLSGSVSSSSSGLRSGPRSVDDRAERKRITKSYTEGSSTSAELQARLEVSWRALLVPARQRLDFLQKYSTIERALELPRIAHLLEIASKAVPLREKVIGILWRLENNGEPMPSLSTTDSVFSSTDEELLYELDCWVDFPPIDPRSVEQIALPVNCDPFDETRRRRGQRESGDAADAGARVTTVENKAGATGNIPEWAAGEGLLRGLASRAGEEEKEEGATAAWLRSIGSRLAGKCAEVCDAAWYEMGETITYRGWPVAQGIIPTEAMERAAQRREERRNRDKKEGK